MFLEDRFIQAYWHHFGAQLQKANPDLTIQSVAEYVRRNEQEAPAIVKEMADDLFKKYRGKRYSSGQRVTRELYDRHMGVTALDEFMSKGEMRKGAERGVRGIQHALGAAAERVGQLTDVEMVEQFGAGQKESAEEALKKLPHLAVTDIEDMGSLGKWLKGTLGSGAVDVAYTMGPAAVATLFTGPVGGAVVGIGMNLPRFYGSNIEAQREAQKEQGVKEPVIDDAKAAGTALVQSAIDFVAERFLVSAKGVGVIGKVLQGMGRQPTESAVKTVQKSLGAQLKGVVSKIGAAGTAGAVEEGFVSELSQQILERWQAGKPLADDEAVKEYMEAIAAGGVVGGAARAMTDGIATVMEREAPTEPEEGTTPTIEGMEPEPEPEPGPGLLPEGEPGPVEDAPQVEEPTIPAETQEPAPVVEEAQPAPPETRPPQSISAIELEQDVEAGARQRLNPVDLKEGDEVLLQPAGEEAKPIVARVEQKSEDLVRYVDHQGNIVATDHLNQPESLRTEPAPVPYQIIDTDLEEFAPELAEQREEERKAAEQEAKEAEKRTQKVAEYTGHIDAAMGRLTDDISNEDDAKMLARHRGSDMFDELPAERQQEIDRTLRRHRQVMEEAAERDKAEREAWVKTEREQFRAEQRQERMEREERARQEREEKGWRQIGVNEQGLPLFENEQGVRSYVRGGTTRISESISQDPGGEVGVQPDKRGGEFLTTEERQARPEGDPNAIPERKAGEGIAKWWRKGLTPAGRRAAALQAGFDAKRADILEKRDWMAIPQGEREAIKNAFPDVPADRRGTVVDLQSYRHAKGAEKRVYFQEFLGARGAVQLDRYNIPPSKEWGDVSFGSFPNTLIGTVEWEDDTPFFDKSGARVGWLTFTPRPEFQEMFPSQRFGDVESMKRILSQKIAAVGAKGITSTALYGDTTLEVFSLFDPVVLEGIKRARAAGMSPPTTMVPPFASRQFERQLKESTPEEREWLEDRRRAWQAAEAQVDAIIEPEVEPPTPIRRAPTPKIERQPVTSSNLKSVGYDPETRILEIEFQRGQVYHYQGVPQEVYDGLMAAESPGRYFASEIRPTYDSGVINLDQPVEEPTGRPAWASGKPPNLPAIAALMKTAIRDSLHKSIEGDWYTNGAFAVRAEVPKRYAKRVTDDPLDVKELIAKMQDGPLTPTALGRRGVDAKGESVVEFNVKGEPVYITSLYIDLIHHHFGFDLEWKSSNVNSAITAFQNRDLVGIAMPMRRFAGPFSPDDGTPQAEPEPETEPETETPVGAGDPEIIGRLASRLMESGFGNITEARNFIGNLLGEPVKAGTLAAKRAEELVEAAVVQAGRVIVEEGGPNVNNTFASLQELYRRQPRLGTRTADSSRRQAYSTPIHIAYAAAILADADVAPVVLEPTAGNGALLVATSPTRQTAFVNEIDRARATNIRRQGFAVSEHDAAADTLYEKVPQVDSLVANPPFGKLKDEHNVAEGWVVDVGDGGPTFGTDQIDHAIAMQSLKTLAPDGRAVLIVGGLSKQTAVDKRPDGYFAEAKRKFYWRLYEYFNVTDHFTLSGKEYERQGAGWPIDVIVIEGRGRSQLEPPWQTAPPLADIDNLIDKVVEYARDRETRRQGDGDPEQPAAGGEAEGDAGDAGGGREPRDAAGDVAGEPDGGPTGEQPVQRPEPRPRSPRQGTQRGQRRPAGGREPEGTPPDISGLGERPESDITRVDPPEPITEPPPPAPEPSGFGSKNKLVTQDRMAELRRQLADKANRLSAGIDPDLFRIGTEMAVYYIEGGVRAFADFARAMTRELNDIQAGLADTLRPYFKVWYEGARSWPEADYAQDMSPVEDVDAEIASWTEPEPTPERELPPHIQQYQRMVDEELRRLEGDPTNAEAADELNALKRVRNGYATLNDEMKGRIDAALAAHEAAITPAPEPEPTVEPEVEPEPEPTSQSLVDKLVAGERKVPYVSASKNKGENVLVPALQATMMKQTLENFGIADVDQFVMDKLHYTDPDKFQRAFFGAQVDALAIAISKIERGMGFINGDQTGLGKGRFVAGIMRFAIAQGRIPVFLTDNVKLYRDIWRDMYGIGLDEFIGHDPVPLVTNASDRILVEDREGKEVVIGGNTHNWTNQRYRGILANISDGKDKPLELPNGERYDMIFSTYSQMQTVHAEFQARHQFLAAIMPESYLILDESHLAGGQETPPRTSAQRPHLPRSDVIYSLIQASQGTAFASATFAKNPYVLSLYAPKTGLQELTLDQNRRDFAAMLKRGGLPMQSVVSRGMVQDLSYMRREHDFSGVVIENRTSDVETKTYATFSDLVLWIDEWDRNVAQGIRDRFIEDLRAQGIVGARDSAVGQTNATQATFGSIIYNVVKQFLLAVKADQTANMAIQSWKDGKKPIIAVDTTMEAVFEDLGLKAGDMVELPFTEVLRRYLRRTLRVTLRYPDNRRDRLIPIPDDFLMSHERQHLQTVHDQISESELPMMPVSPIDWMHRRMRDAGMKTGELTGRSFMFDYTPAEAQDEAHPSRGMLKQRPKSETTKAGQNATIQSFNDGDLDGLIMNRAAATGVSMHSSVDFKDQRQREMFIIDPPANVDDYIQVTGRVKRFGQVNNPRYTNLMAAVPAEQRVAAQITGKLKTMNANVTADEQSEFTNKESIDFINYVGDEVVHTMFEEDEWMQVAIRLHMARVTDNGWVLAPKKDFAKRITGKAILLPPSLQEKMYAGIADRFVEFVQREIDMGNDPFGIPVYDFQAKLLSTTELIGATNPTSAFGGAVNATTQLIKVLRKPYKQETMIGHVAKFYGEESLTAEDLTPRATSHKRKMREDLDLWQRMDQDRAETLEKQREKLNATSMEEEDRNRRITEIDTAMRNTMRTFGHFISNVAPGDGVAVKFFGLNHNEDEEAEAVSFVVRGIVTGVPTDWNTKNPNRWNLNNTKIKVDVLHQAKEMTFALGKIDLLENIHSQDNRRRIGMQRDQTFIRGSADREPVSIVEAFKNFERADTEEAVILTGNVARAAMQYRSQGSIVVFTTDQNEQEIGLHMQRGFDVAEEKSREARRINNADIVLPVMQYAAQVDGTAVVHFGFHLNGDRRLTLSGSALQVALIRDSSESTETAPDLVSVFGDLVRFDPGQRGNPWERQGAWVQTVDIRQVDPEQISRMVSVLRRGSRDISIDVANADAYEQWKSGANADPRRHRIVDNALDLDLGLTDSIVQRIYEAAAQVLPPEVAVEIRSRADGENVGEFQLVDAVKPVISVAMAEDPLATFHHETVHALMNLGLFTLAEQRTLARAADVLHWQAKHGIPNRYPDASPMVAFEEAVAEEYAAWEKGRSNAPSAIQRLFQRIHDFLGRVVVALHLEGLAPGLAATGVFTRIRGGEVGARRRVPPSTSELMDNRERRAWHGSPSDHDRFTTAKIGTGEGAQTYGWGLYFADRKEVAEYYRNALAKSNFAKWSPEKKQEFLAEVPSWVWSKIDAILPVDFVTDNLTMSEVLQSRVHYLDELISEYNIRLDEADSLDNQEEVMAIEEGLTALHELRGRFVEVERGAGKLYEVELVPEDDELLDWDAPFEGQSEKVKAALRSLGERRIRSGWESRNWSGMEIYTRLTSNLIADYGMQREYAREASSKDLRAVGIRGIKYWDQQSRQHGEGTRNYVIFDEVDVQIVKKYRKRVRERRIKRQFKDIVEDALKESGHESAADVAEELEKSTAGTTPKTWREKVMEVIRVGKHRATRRFETLPENDINAPFIERVRALHAAPEIARSNLEHYLTEFSQDLSEDDLKVLTGAFAMEDFLWTADQGMELPSGLDKDNPKQVAAVLTALKRRIADSPVLTDRWHMHYRMLEDMRKRILQSGVLPEERMRNKYYFMHDVLAYSQIEDEIGRSQGKKVVTPHYHQRHGSTENINLNYHQVWARFLYRAEVDIATAQFLNWLRDPNSGYNKAPLYRERAIADNSLHLGEMFHESMKEIVGKEIPRLASAVYSPALYLTRVREMLQDGSLSSDVVTDARYRKIRIYGLFRNAIGRGMYDLRDAIRELNDVQRASIPQRFDRAVMDLYNDAGDGSGTTEFYNFLSWIIEESDLDTMTAPAAAILSATARRRSWVRRTLGDQFVDPDKGEALLKAYATPDEDTWQADSYDGKTLKVNMWMSKTVPDRLFQAMADKITELVSDDETKVDIQTIIDFMSRMDKMKVMGSPKEQMILDKGMIGALNNIGDAEAQAWLMKGLDAVTRTWKMWTLFNPVRFARYILNNLSGDIDAIMASGYGTAVLGKLGQAYRDLRAFERTGQGAPLLLDARQRGILWSAQTVQEVSDASNAYTESLDQREPLILRGRIGGYFRGVRGLATKRENIFRYAAYLAMHEHIVQRGQNPLETGYGATHPTIIKGLRGNDLAARMAVDIMGDYWISHSGRRVRKYMIPFWSWQESNGRRYINLIGNVWRYGRDVGARKSMPQGAWVAASLLVRMAAVHAAYIAWNKLVAGEEEDELSDREKIRPHLTMPFRGPNGEIIKISSEFALPDFLGWFGYREGFRAMQEVAAGRATIWDVLNEIRKAPVNRVISSITPVYKTPLELWQGQSLWPDATRPRAIDDRWQHLASTFSMQGVYDLASAAFGAPIAGPSIGKRLLSTALVDTLEPGEQAYLNIRAKAFDWLRNEKGQQPVSRRKNETAQLLYYYRKALRHGRPELAAEIREMMQEAILEATGRRGRPRQRIRQSLRFAQPLGMLTRRWRGEFLGTLSADEEMELRRAREWFKETYR